MASAVVQAVEGPPAWMAPYVERLCMRYPEVVEVLGHPALVDAYHTPSSGRGHVEISDADGLKVVRVFLPRRADEGAAFTDVPEGTSELQHQLDHLPQAAVPLPTFPEAFAPFVDDDVAFPEPSGPRSPGNFSSWPSSKATERQGRAFDGGRSNSTTSCGSSDLEGGRRGSGELSRSTSPNRSILRRRPSLATSSRSLRTISIHLPDGSDEEDGALTPRCTTSQSPSDKLVKTADEVDKGGSAALAAPMATRGRMQHSLSTGSLMMRLPHEFWLPVASSEPNSRMVSPTYSVQRSPTVPLSERRGLMLKIAQKLDSNDDSGMLVVSRRCSSTTREGQQRRMFSPSGGPERNQPAVQLMSTSWASEDDFGAEAPHVVRARSLPVFVAPRLLPGAFNNHRTVFFFDWDDTLCPTSWIRSLLKDKLADMEEWALGHGGGACHPVDWQDQIPSWFNQPLPDEPLVHEYVAELQEAVIHLLNVAQAFGVVCIVTNAVPGWVEKTIKRWLPRLRQYIHGHGSRPPIQIRYGQQDYVRPQNLDGLPWLDDLGEHMWWKHAAMTKALEKVDQLYRMQDETCELTSRSRQPFSWCSSSESKRIQTVVSIGDNEAEMQAAALAMVDHESHGHSGGGSWSRRRRHSTVVPPCQSSSGCQRVKLVKFRECMHVRMLKNQLDELAEALPQVVLSREGGRVDCGHGDDIMAAFLPSNSKDALLRSAQGCEADAALRVQTV